MAKTDLSFQNNEPTRIVEEMLYKIGRILAIFTGVLALICGIAAYVFQISFFKEQEFRRNSILLAVVIAVILLAGMFIALAVLNNYMKDLNAVVGELAEIRRHAKYLEDPPDRDELTGIRNRTAYNEYKRKLERERTEGIRKFGFGVIGMESLKKLNEDYGEDKGNIAIKKLCTFVCTVFKRSMVFRIADDEFAVVLKDYDYDIVDELVGIFNDEIEAEAEDDSLEPWERISAAIGIALFDHDKDGSADDVFDRARANMNRRKEELKAANK